MNLIERLINMADKWRDANREVHDVCRDGAEEIRVLQTENKGLKKQLTIYEQWSKTQYISYGDSNSTFGWGKGKDE